MKINRLLVALVLLLGVGTASAVDWELTKMDGKTANLTDYHGQWVIVNFWATWCPPCREEIPELIHFHDEQKGKAVVLGIDFEELEAGVLEEFVDEYMMSYPIFTLKPSNMTPLGSVPGLPTTYMIAPTGEVVARQVGMVSEEMLISFMQSWEEENKVTTESKVETQKP
ncbi:MAG: TlpA disulfide reductase family protein [Gammaproteobacteria bacterium]|nr:TlpA disulfide reductase family protein [Gammaproteobacteria bacterium]